MMSPKLLDCHNALNRFESRMRLASFCRTMSYHDSEPYGSDIIGIEFT